MVRVFSGITAGIILSVSAGWAQDSDKKACEAGDRNGMVAIVICPAGLEQEDWKAAGEMACGEELPCGAWIWEDAALAPQSAPERHDLLSKEQITNASAIWVAEEQQLILIGKEAKK